jgi:hypothetical protein
LSAGASITATGAKLNLGEQNPNFSNLYSPSDAWDSDGTISATNNSTVILDGFFTKASLATITHDSSSGVGVVGTEDDTALPVYADFSAPSSSPQGAFGGYGWDAGQSQGNVTAQFPTPLTFNSVVLTASIPTRPGDTYEDIYRIYASNDGVKFTLLGDGSGYVTRSPAIVAGISFPTTNARFLRIWVAVTGGFGVPDAVINNVQHQDDGKPVTS